LVRRTYGGEGVEFGRITEELDADLVPVGSRGLDGTKAILGRMSDVVVHYTPWPALVVPHPLLASEAAALIDGPGLVGWDGSVGAAQAWAVFHRNLAAVLGCGGLEPAFRDPTPRACGIEPGPDFDRAVRRHLGIHRADVTAAQRPRRHR
jgi:hypothetical protein